MVAVAAHAEAAAYEAAARGGAGAGAALRAALERHADALARAPPPQDPAHFATQLQEVARRYQYTLQRHANCHCHFEINI